MKKLDYRYLVQKMIKFVWIGLIVGALVAGAIFLKDRLSAKTGNTNTSQNDSLLFSNYNGDYSSSGLSSRYIFLNYTFKGDAVDALEEVLVSKASVDYSWEYGDLILRRVNNLYFRMQIYEKMLNTIPDIRPQQRYINYGILDEMIQSWVDHRSSIYIEIKTPQFAISGETNEQQCAYRDCVYDAVSEIVNSGVLYNDLPVIVTRADRSTEAVFEEQSYVINVLRDSAAGTQEAISQEDINWKKLLIFFAIGFVFSELVILLILALNKTVKGAKDLENNTDLAILDTVTSEEHDWRILAEKLRVKVPPQNELVILMDEALASSKWDKKIAAAMTDAEEDMSISGMTGFSLSAADIHSLAQKNVLLAVEKGTTRYPDLKKLSETLKQIQAKVIGAVIKE